VIEPDETLEEGPFGEFLGYMAEQAPRPTVRFHHMSSRENPIYQDIVAGQVEHLTMSAVTLRARLHRDYFRDIPAVTEFLLPAPMTIFLSIDAEAYPDFDAQALMDRLLEREAYLKYAYAFDADVELRKLGSVQTALACFAQPARDFTVTTDCDGNGIDPSEVEGRTSKVAVDARARQAMTRSDLPEEVLADFNPEDWLS
jgi:UbiD family decarboxylase